MRRLILAAALAAASASFAFAPAFADDTTGTIASSDESAPAVSDLGVDISGVMLSPAGVHSFLSSLAPETRRAVEDACGTYSRYPAGASEQTLAFCADAHKA